MWILGLLLILVIFGLRNFIKILIGWFIFAYIMYLLAVFCPPLAAALVIGAIIKYYVF